MRHKPKLKPFINGEPLFYFPIVDIDDLCARIDKPSENVTLMKKEQLINSGAYVKTNINTKNKSFDDISGIKRISIHTKTPHFSSKGKSGKVKLIVKDGKKVNEK